jgi:hypothetical protein
VAAWRGAKRLASTLPESSPEHEAAQRACDRLRDAYQDLTYSGVAAALTVVEARILLVDAASESIQADMKDRDQDDGQEQADDAGGEEAAIRYEAPDGRLRRATSSRDGRSGRDLFRGAATSSGR